MQSGCLYTSLAICKCHILDNPSRGLRADTVQAPTGWDTRRDLWAGPDTERGPMDWDTHRDHQGRAKDQDPRGQAKDRDLRGQAKDRDLRGQVLGPIVPAGNRIGARCRTAPRRTRPALHSRGRGRRAIRGQWRLPGLLCASARPRRTVFDRSGACEIGEVGNAPDR